MGLITENQTESKELVFCGENSQVLTNSLLVAEKFGKRHGDVIRSIEKLLNTEDETLNAKMRLAFESTSYIESSTLSEKTRQRELPMS